MQITTKSKKNKTLGFNCFHNLNTLKINLETPQEQQTKMVFITE